MSQTLRSELEARLLRASVARLRASVMAIVLGSSAAVGLFVATAWLLIRGGERVGEHLSLLANYFPGYSVTWPGALVGLGYGFASGAVVGWSVAWIYNWIVEVREPS